MTKSKSNIKTILKLKKYGKLYKNYNENNAKTKTI